jgi:hypothetical protein
VLIRRCLCFCLFSIEHPKFSRGNGRLSTPRVVKIDEMGSYTLNLSKGGPVKCRFEKTEFFDVRYISVNTFFGGENGTAMARAIFETVTGWVRGAVRLNGFFWASLSVSHEGQGPCSLKCCGDTWNSSSYT